MRSDPSGQRLRADGGGGAWAALPAYGLVAWVLGAVACALLPLPRFLVDLLLTLSLGGSIMVLVASLTVRRSVELLGFPRLLLMMTLTRLALNVTTTRLILTDADAGRVIDAFATLVIQDDLLVGAVMFAVVTIVQFVIVARGGERIAEVAARFALDGLPGQQAAIEADLRAGSITPAEAANRRARLLERSSFYGSMDGAAKYIRGDAIVGLALTSINLVGGTVAGVREGLGVGAALDLYGRLTIGDGLLAQVPALLVGLAASLLVARVEGEAPRGGPGWVTPAVLAAPAGLLAALSLAPGMPGAAFVITALGLGAVALWLSRARARASRRRQIVVCLAGQDEKDIAALRRPLVELRRRCAAALGIEVPEIVAVAATSAPGAVGSSAARGPGSSGPGAVVAPAASGPVAGSHAIVVRLGERVISVPEDMDEKPWSEGHVIDAAVVATFRAVMRHAEALIDLQTIEGALEAARTREPALVREALRAVGAAELLELSRGLLRERVPLPPLPVLLEAVAAEPALRRPELRSRWLEALRVRLAPYWVLDVVEARARLGAVTWVRPTPDAEQVLLGLVVAGEGGTRLRLSAAGRRAWRTRALAAAGEDGAPPLLLCSPRARPAFALLLGRGAPHVAVLSTGELQEVDLPVPGEPGGPAAAWFEAP